jgi:ABC-type bacteriocin/lantibiotic exporter with double-glycine peptidase domain
MRYRANTPIVLDGLQLNIQPREKLGIVGRTGSGKTSVQLIVRVVCVYACCWWLSVFHRLR